eukprot:3624884-Pleurochrysis_carterae.AAC.2
MGVEGKGGGGEVMRAAAPRAFDGGFPPVPPSPGEVHFLDFNVEVCAAVLLHGLTVLPERDGERVDHGHLMSHRSCGEQEGRIERKMWLRGVWVQKGRGAQTPLAARVEEYLQLKRDIV